MVSNLVARRHHVGKNSGQSTRQSRTKSLRASKCFAAAIAVGGLYASNAHAASQTWVAAPTDANWSTTTNWSGNAVPGSTTTTTNDTATFNAALSSGIGGASNPIVIDANRRIGSILFDTANAGPYVIGATGGNTLLLSAQTAATNSITMTAAVTNSETLAGPIQMTQPNSQNDNYAFVNNSTTASANLIISGNITATNTTRTWGFILDGSNTGNNIISGNINNTITTASGPSAITKNGAGTWILSGTNIFTGAPITTAGVQVNAGTLVLENNLALGNTTNAKVFVNAGGTLELNSSSANGSITLDNALTLNMANTSTIRSNGSNTTNSTIKLGTTSALSATLSTVNGGDVFTVGNAANDLTGGASDTVLHVAGPGSILLGQASNYVGTWSLDAGTTTLGNATALGPAASAGVAFGAASTAKLQLNNNSVTLTKLNTNATPGSAIIENGGTSSAATLTLNTTVANTYAGVLQDGSGGFGLALTKSGIGSLTLTGANAYSGNTTISGGTLVVNNSSGSGTGSGNIAVNATATLAGTGSVTGTATVAGSGHLSPGSGGVGTLTVGGLTLNANSNLDYDITNTSTLDQTTVTNSGGLTINGGQLNINGGGAAFTTNGVYNLINYSGSIGGTGVSALTLNSNNENLATNTYTFGASGSAVTLTIASSGGSVIYWNTDSDGNWSTVPTGLWTGAVPNAAGAFASFGGGGTAITANRIITVDGSYTVGTLAFNNAAGDSYTLAAGAGANITLDNNATGAFVTDSAGSHTIQSPLTLTSLGASFTVANSTDTLTVSGAISGSGDVLTKSGTGTLALTGSNSYSGGTNLNGGTIQINSPTSLGDPAGNLVFGGGTLQLLADVATARNYQVSVLSDAVIDTNGHTMTHSGTISPLSGGTGGVVKNGVGTLILQGTNTYTGATTVNGGILSISSNANLGDPATGANLNLNNNATLASTATFALDNAGANSRAIVLGTGGGTIDVADATTLTVSGTITGSATLTKVDTGTLSISNTGNTAPITVAAGTLTGSNTTANGNGGFGTGAITLKGGATINSTMPAGSTLAFANVLTVPTGQTGNLNTPNRFNWTGAVNGAGILNVGVTTTVTRMDLNNNFSAFTGNLNFTGSGSVRLLMNGGTFTANGLASTTVDLEGTVFLAPITNSGGNTVTIGALSGSSATAGLSAGSAGAPTWVIGGVGSTTTFAGSIGGTVGANGIVQKTGAGTLNLTGVNTYTGTTLVDAGTIALGSGGSLGTATADLQISPAAADTTGAVSVAAGASLTTQRVIVGGNSANTTGGAGSLTQTGGTINTGTFFSVGEIGTGTFTMSGGVLNVNTATGANNFEVATFAAANGTVNLSGTPQINLENNSSLVLGAQANGVAQTGTVTQSGGTVTAYSDSGNTIGGTGVLSLGAIGTGTYTYNLAGGTLAVSGVTHTTGAGVLNLQGGTLQAVADNASFMQGLSSANVGAGGAVIDSNSHAITVAQVLSHDATGPAIDGGLTKNGVGTLTLSGASTYTGNTTVNTGTLAVSSAGGLPNGTNLTANGTAQFSNAAQTIGALNGSASGIVTVDSGSALTVTGAGTFAGTVNANGTVNFPGTTGSTASARTLGALNVGTGGLTTVGSSTFPFTPATLQTAALNFADTTSKIDLNNNILIAPGTDATALGLITSGQVFSSAGTADLGYITLDATNFEIRWTLLGDTNLDGQVNVSDLGNLATNFGSASATWIQGDFDRNGSVNVADLGDLATNFGQSLVAGSAFGAGAAIAEPSVGISAGVSASAVPEPTSLGLLAVAATGLLARRRRHLAR